MSFQGREVTLAMKELVMNLNRHFDEERKRQKEGSTRHPTWRTAQALGSGAITVKSIRAESRQNGDPLEGQAPHPRGKPDWRAAVNLQPVIREYVRTKNLAGQRVGVEKLRQFLFETHGADIAPVTLWRTWQRWGLTDGTGKRRAALQAQEDVVLARRRAGRQQRANRHPDGRLQRPEVSLEAPGVHTNHAGQFPWDLAEDGPGVNTPAGKGPRLLLVHALTVSGGVPGAAWVFEAAQRTGDEHGPMHGEHVSTGFSEPWLPHIPSHSLLLLDHAPSHNVLGEEAFPTPQSRQEPRWTWCTRHDMPWTPDRVKPARDTRGKKWAPAPALRRDQFANASGHRILRPPPDPPELQPLETCGGIVKNPLADHGDFPLKNVRQQLPMALSKVKPSPWRKLMAKVVEQEEQYWGEDAQLYEHDFDEIAANEDCALD